MTSKTQSRAHKAPSKATAKAIPARANKGTATVAKTRGVPLAEVEVKDMSPEAIHARRSAAQKAATRMVRTSTAAARAADLKVTTAKEGQETVYDTMKKVWSSRGEIVANVGGKQVEVKRSDVIRQLKSLPRDAKTPFKLTPSETDSLVHILA